ncbi:hypothetical protein [Telluribacter humicola]|uniref:hypothetical protein n=1 Tax=Telluribacter humicola TaxID=1720261 RepID=UPI001A96BE3D|nr:hypothetical protein [Telluribacter humicola]
MIRYSRFIFAGLILLTEVSCKNELANDENYPMPWRDPDAGEVEAIGEALAKSRIAGCKEFQVRESTEAGSGDYLIGCSLDDQTWSYYQVSVGDQRVTPLTSNTVSQAPEPKSE